MKKRFAFLTPETEGGVLRVYQTLAEELSSDEWSGERVGTKINAAASSEEARRLLDELKHFDMVVCNIFVSPYLMNVVRYLPSTIPRISIVHNITHATYQAARALQNYVGHTVAVSDRIGDDLVRMHGFRPADVSVVYNGVSSNLFDIPRRHNRSEDPVGILSLGRLEQRAKQILSLPPIMSGIPSQLYHLTIAGDGPEAAELRRRLTESTIEARTPGWIAKHDLARIYSEHEIFLFPSRFEGMPIALAEAMAAGLVPISARIPGVTDQIIQHGVNGYLFDQGDIRAARHCVESLLSDVERRQKMSHSARLRAESLFHPAVMAKAYSDAFLKAAAASERIRALEIKQWSIPYRMRPGLRSLIPATLRQKLANALLYK